MTKEFVLAQLHRLYRNDPWVGALFSAAGASLDQVADVVLAAYESNWFDTMPEEYVRRYESRMGLTAKAGQTLEDRRSAIEAKWKSSGTVGVDLLQAVADSWRNGEVNVDFVGGKIDLTFNSIYGVPADLTGLLSAIDDVKPAHLAVVYTLRYLLIKDVHNTMTLAELERQSLGNFAGGGA